ncbi:biotin/lipoyl-containing protein [Cerasicoccus fimbriatus]|uniref:biotin/lipoyl-containing protein n=1 Tax=Cerasicoccus fimbriatus TaxID=3014554 RepID=UPI0022B3F04D|nr:biotin/lipoyl-containing protein [Cerasicoccus sp. TK19100]
MKRLKITVEGKTYEVEVEMLDDDGQPMASASAPVKRSAPRRAAAAPAPVGAPAPKSSGGSAAAGDVPSPLSAVVVSVDVKVGQQVNEGEKLITLEAMKMNTIVNAPAAGTVKAIHVAAGDAVEEGQGLISVE